MAETFQAKRVKSGRWVGTGPAGRCHGHDHGSYGEAIECAKERNKETRV